MRSPTPIRGGGSPGFAGGDARELRLPTALLDEPTLARPGMGFGALFLLPGIGATLRVNGRVAGAVLSVPGVTGLLLKGLEKDYKNNLY